jgi:nuclear receptor co-repressor 1
MLNKNNICLLYFHIDFIFFLGGECSSGITQACAVCKTESVCWRALPRSQASQYGLKEDQIPADARVCNLCRCKAVRSRYIMCPFPTCPNTKGHRVKRLRSMPCKWLDLPPAIKDPIAAEFR